MPTSSSDATSSIRWCIAHHARAAPRSARRVVARVAVEEAQLDAAAFDAVGEPEAEHLDVEALGARRGRARSAPRARDRRLR